MYTWDSDSVDMMRFPSIPECRNLCYLIFHALHQSSALRDNVAGHLLPCLGHSADLELYHLPFLQTVCFAGHADYAKRVALSLSACGKTESFDYTFLIFGLK